MTKLRKKVLGCNPFSKRVAMNWILSADRAAATLFLVFAIAIPVFVLNLNNTTKVQTAPEIVIPTPTDIITFKLCQSDGKSCVQTFLCDQVGGKCITEREPNGTYACGCVIKSKIE